MAQAFQSNVFQNDAFEVSSGGAAYTLDAQPTSYAVAGQAAALVSSKQLTSSSTSYTLTYPASTLLKAVSISASAGAFTLSGQPATLNTSKVLVASAGAYSYLGQSLTFTAARTLNLTSATYTLTGADSSVSSGKVFGLTSGSFVITGQTAELVVQTPNKILSADAATFLVSGSSSTFVRSHLLDLGATSYVLTSADAEFKLDKYFQTGAGEFDIAGAAASLTSGKLLVLDSLNSNSTYVDPGYVESGYVAGALGLAIERGYVSGGYAIPGYVGTSPDAYFGLSRTMASNAASFTMVGKAATLVAGGVLVWPDPSQVLLDVTYGPTGSEYVGTYTDSIRLELETGRLVKPIGAKLSILL